MKFKPKNIEDYLKRGCGRCDLGGTDQCKVHTWETILSASIELVRSYEPKHKIVETIKWGNPCFTLNNKNLFMVSALKSHVVISFFQGEYFSDPKKILEKPGPNAEQGRILKITQQSQLTKLKPKIFNFIEQAVELRLKGTPSKKSSPSPINIDLPPELIECFDKDKSFKSAFEALTPGRQKGFLLHFQSAKQASTRFNRIEKSKPKVFAGKGWNEY